MEAEERKEKLLGMLELTRDKNTRLPSRLRPRYKVMLFFANGSIDVEFFSSELKAKQWIKQRSEVCTATMHYLDTPCQYFAGYAIIGGKLKYIKGCRDA